MVVDSPEAVGVVLAEAAFPAVAVASAVVVPQGAGN